MWRQETMKSQDILVLFKLVALKQQVYGPAELKALCSARALAGVLGVGKSEVNASINRSIDAGLALKDRKFGYPKVNVNALLEFVCYGVKYVFPVQPGALVRGIPTAFDAPVLQGELLSAGDAKVVWPASTGNERGQAVKPLYSSVPEAVTQDAQLYAYLALVDAIRLGNPRESKLAQRLLRERLSL